MKPRRKDDSHYSRKEREEEEEEEEEKDEEYVKFICTHVYPVEKGVSPIATLSCWSLIFLTRHKVSPA